MRFYDADCTTCGGEGKLPQGERMVRCSYCEGRCKVTMAVSRIIVDVAVQCDIDEDHHQAGGSVMNAVSRMLGMEDLVDDFRCLQDLHADAELLEWKPGSRT